MLVMLCSILSRGALAVRKLCVLGGYIGHRCNGLYCNFYVQFSVGGTKGDTIDLGPMVVLYHVFVQHFVYRREQNMID